VIAGRRMKAHPQFERIREKITTFAGLSYSGVCYRCTEPKYAGEIVSGMGSQLYGARWTPKGSFPTVYLCESPEAALQEFLARGRRMKIPDHKALPMVMAGVTMKVDRILDASVPEIQEVIQHFLAEEKEHWRAIQDRREAVSQAIGRAAHEICFSGLIVPSQALGGDQNLVIFPKKLRPGDVLSTPKIEPAL
jgi:RES domain-containing protein